MGETVYKMAATSVVVLDRGNNTTCTINLHGKYSLFLKDFVWIQIYCI